MIKIFIFFGILLAILLLSFIYSCENRATQEVPSNLEDEVLNTSEADLKIKMEEQTLKWCIFGNFCDTTGRHYPARFMVNIWNFRDGEKKEQLYSNLSNNVELNEDEDFAGSTICLNFKNIEGIDKFYVEIRILSSEAYGSIAESTIRKGVIDKNEILNLYVGENQVDYFHFREGCGSSDSPELLQISK